MKKLITRIVAFISFVLVAMETFNKIVLYLAKLDNKVKPIVDKTYNWHLGDIKYLVKGEGEPLLLIHDLMPGSSSLEWKKVIDSLAKKYKVYALDLPGFGVSDKNIKTYTNYLYTSAVCDFISDVIKEKTTVVTSFEAASIAILSAYNRNNLFDKLVLVNPESMEYYNQKPDKNNKNSKNIFSLPIVGTFMYLINILRCTSLNEDELFAAQYDGENARHYFGSYINNYVNFPIHHRISEVSVPILLISDKSYTEYEEYIDNHYIMKNASQFPHLEQPEAFCEAFDNLMQYDYNDK